MEAEERTETGAAGAEAAPGAEKAPEKGAAVRKSRSRARAGEKAGSSASRPRRTGRKKAAPAEQPALSPAPAASDEPEIEFPEDGVVNHPEKSPETESAAEALPEPPAAEDEGTADAGADDPEIPFPEEESGDEEPQAADAPEGDADAGPVKDKRASGRSALERIRAVIRRFLGSPSRIRRKELPDDDPELMRLRALRRFPGAGREEEKSHEFRSL